MKNLILAILSLILLFLSGCSNNKDLPAIYPFDLFIQIEGTNGENILDSLKVSDDKVLRVPFSTKDNGYISIRCIRNSDGQEMEVWNTAWFNTRLDSIDSTSINPIEVMALGRILTLSWVDDRVWDTERKKKRYDESYTLYLTSPKFFGTDIPKTIKCYIHVDGNSCDAYRYDVDGKQITVPDNTFFYDSRNQSQKELKALIKIRK